MKNNEKEIDKHQLQENLKDQNDIDLIDDSHGSAISTNCGKNDLKQNQN